jgi:hypothetical protein
MKKNLRNVLNEIVTNAVKSAVDEAVDRIGKLTLGDVQDNQPVAKTTKTPKPKATVKVKNLTVRAKALKLNGRYMGMLRAFSVTDTKRIKKIRIEKGVAAAIAAMKNGLPKVAKKAAKAVVKAAPKAKIATKAPKPKNVKKIEEETPVEVKDEPVAEQQATVVEQPAEVSAPAVDMTPVDVT